MKRKLLTLFLSALFVLSGQCQNVIPMEKSRGIYLLPCEINGLRLKFIFDTGASDVSISLAEAVFMLKNGYLKESDLTGTTYAKIANGDIVEGTKLNLRELKIGTKTLYNVSASIVHSLEASLLLGQSALSRLGRFQMDYSNNTLTFYDGSSNPKPAGTNSSSQEVKQPIINNPSINSVLTLLENSMILVKGGTFLMGCNNSKDGNCQSDESPTHWVTISDYYLSKFELTQKEWFTIMGKQPSHFHNCDNCPVDNVSWDDIQQFLSKVNEKTGYSYRLPTEAEWEYAARGGTLRKGNKYSGGNSIYEVAWFKENSRSRTQPVGQKMANELGLYDMSGNVWEWCHDWKSNYSSSTQINPNGPNSGSYRIARGGSWSTESQFCRIPYRGGGASDERMNSFGFRLARTP